MKLYSQYSWLCLCLIFSLVMVSCASRRTGTVQAPPMVNNDNITYQLEVKLRMDGTTDELPGEYAAFLVNPLTVMYSRNYLVLRPQNLLLYFRFPDVNQMEQCRDRLLSAGGVIQIIAVKY